MTRKITFEIYDDIPTEVVGEIIVKGLPIDDDSIWYYKRNGETIASVSKKSNTKSDIFEVWKPKQ